MIAVARWAAALVDPLGFSPHLLSFTEDGRPNKEKNIP